MTTAQAVVCNWSKRTRTSRWVPDWARFSSHTDAGVAEARPTVPIRPSRLQLAKAGASADS